MPDLELSDNASAAQLSFWSSDSYPDDFAPGNNTVVLLDGDMETVLWSAETVNEIWEENIIDLTAYLGQTVSLAFKYAGDNGNGWYVDDVEVSVTPATTITQTIELVAGWNWISTYIDGEPVALLDMMKESLGDNAMEIQSFDLSTEYDGEWWGELDEIGITNDQMYMILVSNACTVELTGMPVDVSSYEISIKPGWNWIGFPSAEAVDIIDAFADFEAEIEDVIQGVGTQTEYDGEWWGDLETLVPSRGYMYYSNSDEVKTLVFQTGRSKTRPKANTLN